MSVCLCVYVHYILCVYIMHNNIICMCMYNRDLQDRSSEDYNGY